MPKSCPGASYHLLIQTKGGAPHCPRQTPTNIMRPLQAAVRSDEQQSPHQATSGPAEHSQPAAGLTEQPAETRASTSGGFSINWASIKVLTQAAEADHLVHSNACMSMKVL